MNKIKGFLREGAKNVYLREGEDMFRATILFPNKRSALFFREALREHVSSHTLFPNILSMNDFLYSYLGYAPMDDSDKYIYLYDSYKALVDGVKALSYEDFLYFAPHILSDFNMIDAHLLDARAIYTYVYDDKAMREHFSYEEGAYVDAMRKFWSSFKHLPEEYRNRFMSLWQLLFPLYERFRSLLRSGGFAYYGQALREVCDRVAQKEVLFRDSVYFMGFNDISPSEKRIISHGVMLGKAQVHWNIQSPHIQDNGHMAGHFLCKHMEDACLSKTFSSREEAILGSNKKEIEVHACSSGVSQARKAGALLRAYCEKSPFPKERIAVLLPKASTLFPLLFSLPEEIISKELNITMGYDVWHSPLSDLVMGFLRIHQGLCTEEAYFSWLGNSYLRTFDRHSLQRHGIFDRHRIAEEFEILHSALEKKNAMEALDSFLLSVQGLLEMNKFEEALLVKFRQKWKELMNTSVRAHIAGLSSSGLVGFFKRFLKSIKIPFVSDSLKGIHIMGLPEAINLDFDAVFILDMNEGALPEGWQQDTLLPWSLRHQYGLPMQEDFDARQTYIFYNLLPRAQVVHLFYLTQQEKIDKKEKSRFLHQLEYDDAYSLTHSFDSHAEISPRPYAAYFERRFF